MIISSCVSTSAAFVVAHGTSVGIPIPGLIIDATLVTYKFTSKHATADLHPCTFDDPTTSIRLRYFTARLGLRTNRTNMHPLWKDSISVVCKIDAQ